MIGWIVALTFLVLSNWLAWCWWNAALSREEIRIDRQSIARRRDDLATALDASRQTADMWESHAVDARREAHELRERNAELKRQLAEHEDEHDLRLSSARFDELVRMFDVWRGEDVQARA